jgi:hypothetical protein
MNHGPDRPLTAEGVLAWARSQSRNPSSVRRHLHPFEGDPAAGGYACVSDRSIYWAMHDGGFGASVLGDRDVDAHLDDAWARSRHAQRVLDPGDLGPWQRAAVRAVEARTTIARLDPEERPGLDTGLDRDHADWIWIQLRSSRHGPLRALARNDTLLQPPATGGRFASVRRTHPCPLCQQPAPHQDRYPRAVCDDCRARTVDAGGRPVTGANTAMSGGFEARHDDGSRCEEVTRTGAVTVDGHACRMGEARFGGIVVEAV